VTLAIRKLFLGTLLLGLPALPGAAEELDHLIKPGYQPEEAQDEQGLWMEFKEMERELNKSALLVRDAELRNYIEGIVCRVAGDYCNDFRVYLVRNPGFNASMTATGMMQVWTGLIVRASSTDEIAAVIGHEIAHYTRLHSLQGLRKLKSRMTTGSVFDVGLAVLTGVSTPLGQAAAMLNYLSFNREQETEADLLGTRLLAEAAYDPHAAYGVWYRLLEEENAAAVKREKIGMFSRTHPNSEDRASYLKNYVDSRYGPPDVEQVADQELLDILNHNYLLLMEDQLDTNRFGRTREILGRHARIGVQPGLVNYFFGEMYRQRGDEGDQKLAIAAYTKSVESGTAPAEAYKNLGYLYLKAKDLPRAQDSFRQYLEINPGASDRAMIEFYLAEDER
jgi:predicted Zn-dependent protease